MRLLGTNTILKSATDILVSKKKLLIRTADAAFPPMLKTHAQQQWKWINLMAGN